ncbi:hypothetical protein [Desulfovermiculus halophilus]|jgi:uncharacterized small protein (DUF1192 family)|uniref:hypothetical protein n=1 Tax=Desulfovermiculus halophilus TaxID=339722 RepID=UPI0004821D27|nr:hypothetical protein [Desulfovermiculus halophilus]
MSALQWEISFSPEPGAQTKQSLRCSLVCVAGQQRLPVVQDVAVADLEQEIRGLKAELDRMAEEARNKWAELPEQDAGDHGTKSAERTPDQIWEDLRSCSSNAQMQEMFNALPEEVRRKTAEYVLTSVNMFSGAGAFFAQNFDHAAAVLG